jgi:chromatin remodeling complex protein RSC6
MEDIVISEAQGKTSIISEMQGTVKEVIPIDSQFNGILLDLSTFKTLINDMQSKVKLLEKSVIKLNKEREKTNNSIEKKIQQQSSGFDKPITISDAMCAFMNKPTGTTISRIVVSEYMINYIRVNKLQDMNNRKKINANEMLNNLFGLKSDGEELTYFNLQKYLNMHII